LNFETPRNQQKRFTVITATNLGSDIKFFLSRYLYLANRLTG